MFVYGRGFCAQRTLCHSYVLVNHSTKFKSQLSQLRLRLGAKWRDAKATNFRDDRFDPRVGGRRHCDILRSFFVWFDTEQT
jgi:hypothetical protein